LYRYIFGGDAEVSSTNRQAKGLAPSWLMKSILSQFNQWAILVVAKFLDLRRIEDKLKDPIKIIPFLFSVQA
jgi:hypothetical protein